MPILVVQMGHAGRTTGATGAPGEQAYTQAVGAECMRLLNGLGGWTVRTIPADPPASSYKGDAFIAVHADGNNNPAVRGASVGHQNNSGAGLAHAWQNAYVARGFTGPWHPDNYTEDLHWYYGVTDAIKAGNTRACIIETGTITNPEDWALMDPARVALAIGDAIGIIQPVPVAPNTQPEGNEDDVTVVTCATPNHSGLLLPTGDLIDITADATARSSAQGHINDKTWAEWRVEAATWNLLAAPPAIP